MMLDSINSEKQIGSKYFNVDGPLMIAYDITNKCNFKCLHCYNSSGVGKSCELDDSEVISLMKEIIKIKPIVLCFCGGEPLIRANLILDCLKVLKGNLSACNMVSNGYLLTLDLAKKLHNNGLSAIQFSLDGKNALQHDTFRGVRGAFEHVIKAISYAKKANLRVDISMCPNKLNYKYIGDIIDLCYNLGVSELRSMPLIPMGRGGKVNHLILSANEYVTFQQELLLKKEEYKFKDFNVEWGDPIDHLQRMPNNSKLGIKTYSLEVKSDGDIGASTYFPIKFGNIRDKSLLDYWYSGFDDIWGNKKFTNYFKDIITVSDIGDFSDKQGCRTINIELKK